MSARIWAVAALLAAAPALGQEERPSEDQLFGAPSETPAKDDEPAKKDEPAQGDSKSEEARPSEDAMFGEPGKEQGATQAQPAGSDEKGSDDERLSGLTKNAFESGDQVEDPLKIGGQFYLQSIASFAEATEFQDTSLRAPTLIDVYMDARPSDRLRAMVVGRLSYDPTLPPDATTAGFGTAAARGNPAVLLDQAWLRFDLARTVFVTVGKQHVKWGTGFIWNPTDFLSPTPRNPLLFFDPRVGSSMVKLHIPWEAKGWNFYAIGLLDNTGPADTLGKLGAAGRAEIVLGESELGLDAVFVKGKRPRYGVDFSAALGPIDVYGEAALRFGSDVPVYEMRTVDPANPGPPFGLKDASGFNPQVTVGGTWTIPYSENDTVIVGGEYFYNDLGYTDTDLYPVLLFNNAFNPLYVGKHQAGLYVVLPSPGSWDKTSFTLFNLANLSDLSGQSRLNVSVRVLNYLTLEAFGALHYSYSSGGGVFRFSLDINPRDYGVDAEPIRVNAPIAEVGIGARINI